MPDDQQPSKESRGRRFGRSFSFLSSSKSKDESPSSSSSRWARSRSGTVNEIQQIQQIQQAKQAKQVESSQPKKPNSKPAPIQESIAAPPEPEPESSPEPVQEPAPGPVSVPAPVPAPAKPDVSRRQSKGNLFDLFSKPKVERARGYHEAGLDGVPERSQTPAHFYRPPESDKAQDTPVSSPQQPLGEFTSQIYPQRTPSQKVDSAKLPRQPDNWDPPPLFQAYPQAIKHGALHGVNISTEALLKAQQHRRNMAPGQEGFGSVASLPYVAEGQEENGSIQDAAWRKRFSTIYEGPELLKKVFVLVTAGRLVQYAGDGHYDRHPEKVLQLGQKSVAFACDLIPGKHWVVQVVQAANEDGNPTIKQSRSFLSRLRVTGSRKNASSFLMVFSSADEMDSWLKAIRGVIEQLGGKQRDADPEVRREREEMAVAQKRMSEVPSHRFQVQRDPIRFGENKRESVLLTANNSLRAPSLVDQTRYSIATSAHSSLLDSPALGSVEENDPVPDFKKVNSRESIVPAIAPAENIRQELPKESSRTSFVSSRTSRTSEVETATGQTSICSSSPPSPHKETFVEPEFSRNPAGLKPTHAISNAVTTATAARRRSMQLLATVPDVPAIPASAGARDSVIMATMDRSSIRLSKQFVPDITVSHMKHAAIPATILERPSARPMSPNSRIPDITQSLPRAENFPRMPIRIPDISKRPRPASTIGHLPVRPFNRTETNSISIAATRRPFVRPIPVRPSQPSHTAAVEPPMRNRRASETIIPQRMSSLSLPPTNTLPAPPPSTAPSLVIRASARNSFAPVTSPVHLSTRNTRPFSQSVIQGVTRAPIQSTAQAAAQSATATSAARPLRRPTNLRVRADPAPFLSSRDSASRSRPTGLRSTSAPDSAPPNVHKHITSAIALSAGGAAMAAASSAIVGGPVQGLPQFESRMPSRISTLSNPNRQSLRIRNSMPSIVIAGLPPPKPPPNCPLPSVPPGTAVT